MKTSDQQKRTWSFRINSKAYELRPDGIIQYTKHDYDYILTIEHNLLTIQVNAPINVIALDIRCLYFS